MSDEIECLPLKDIQIGYGQWIDQIPRNVFLPTKAVIFVERRKLERNEDGLLYAALLVGLLAIIAPYTLVSRGFSQQAVPKLNVAGLCHG